PPLALTACLFLRIPPPPRSPLFPYTTLFRSIAMAVAGSLSIEGPVIRWVADHRKHHAFSDREGDPHSPWRYGESLGALTKGLWRSEEHTSELQSLTNLVCRLLLGKKTVIPPD